MTHLTSEERGQIQALLQENYKPKDIALRLSRHQRTIEREIRNRGKPTGYLAKYAHIDYKTRRKRSHCPPKISYFLRDYIVSKLRLGWSPEQISGRMKLEKFENTVCAETIYNFIYYDQTCIQENYKEYLRRGHKKRRKKKGRKVHSSHIPNRTSIHKRPPEVDAKKVFGHWEGDTVWYANKQAIVTMNERTTSLVVFRKVDRKTADLTANAIINGLKKFKPKTITFDNGPEFTHHANVTKKIGTKVYFADPYSAWQRGANENSNMLLRGYLPKKANISQLTKFELNDIAYELNSRPRKRLGFKTPFEVLPKNVLKSIHSGSCY